MAEKKARVAVVFGGRSSEHAISCVTAGSVLGAIDRDKYDVVPIGVATDGRWVLVSAEPDRLAIVDGRLPEVDGSGAALALPSGDQRLVALEPGRVPSELGEVDVVLPLLHGPYGEDGTLQGMLELAGVPYVGAGVFASAASMDKAHMKVMLAAAGIPMTRHVVVRDRDWRLERKRVLDDIDALGWPVFVKPARAGSSEGVGKAAGPDELTAAVEEARGHDLKIVVEAAVRGREVECGVLEALDDGPPEVTMPAEILVRGDHEFYDFAAKYLDEDTELAVPADLPPAVSAEVRRLAAATFEAVACEGLARVDFFSTEDGSVLVNEINTMPGFTPASVFPRAWAASGVDYAALVDRLITSGLRKSKGLH